MHVSKKCLKCKISISNATEREEGKKPYPFSFFLVLYHIFPVVWF